MKSKYAFTLIELSIVLVIIALVVGGVTVGTSLIETSRVRSQLAQIEKLNTTVNAFKTKYGCMPGDCNKAVSLGLGSASGPGANGNGNGSLPSNMNLLSWGFYLVENLNFYYHLQQAGMLESQLNGYTAAYGGIFSDPNFLLQTMLPGKMPSAYIVPVGFSQTNCSLTGTEPTFRVAGNGWYLTGVGSGAFAAAITPNQARLMDQKFDDGMPYTGKIGIGYTGTNCSAVFGSAANACVSSSNYSSNDTVSCVIGFVEQY